jgi:putative ABC transport system permease protein
MWRVTYKGLMARKFRLLMTTLSIVLGVGFVVGTLMFNDTISKTFDDLFADVHKNTDTYVRSQADVDSDQVARERLPQSVLDLVRSSPDVAVADGNIQGTATLIDANGDAVGGQGPPTFGFNWSETELNPMKITEGRAPQADTEIVIDKHSAEKGQFTLGQSVKVQLPTGTNSYTLVGIAKFGSADSLGGASATMFTTAEAQKVFNAAGQYDDISAKAKPGISQDQLTSEITQMLKGQKVEVLTGAEITKQNQSDIKKAFSGFSTFIAIFGYIALGVGTFIIYNTFSILVAQRQRETGLLRAIGASRRQVLGSVLAEATVVGLLAAVIGVGFGYVMAALLRAIFTAFGLDLPSTGLVLRNAVIVQAVILGVVVAVGSAFFPARRASKVPPIAALRDVALDNTAGSKKRLAMGIVGLALAAFLLASGVTGAGSGAAVRVGLSFLAAIIAIAILGPIIARPLSLALGYPLPRTKGITGTLARQNAARNPRRTASTALALTIGVAIVGFILVMAASLKASVNKIVDDQIKADYIVASKTFTGFSPSVADSLKSVPGVRSAMGLSVGVGTIDGANKQLVAIDGTVSDDVYSVDILKGAITDLKGDSIGVSNKVADKNGWTLGSTIDTTFPKGGSVPLKVVAIFDADQTQGSNYLIPTQMYRDHYVEPLDLQVYVRAEPGTDLVTLRANLEKSLTDYPTAELQDRSEFKKQQAAQINQLVTIIYVMLAMAIFIALLGIANTIALSVHERHRELGLLRAVGMTRRQVRSTIRWEAVIIAVMGTIMGLAVGVVFGIAILQPLRDSGLKATSIPVFSLVIVTLIGAVAGVLASARPASKAAKLNVLEAIASS